MKWSIEITAIKTDKILPVENKRQFFIDTSYILEKEVLDVALKQIKKKIDFI